MLCAIDAISYNNYYFFVARLLDISFFMKYIIKNSIFAEKLGHTNLQNNSIVSAFLNFFTIKTITLSTGIALNKYICFIRSN